MASIRAVTCILRNAIALQPAARCAVVRSSALSVETRNRLPRVALTPTRWHSTPSNLPKAYDFESVKTLVESPSQDKIIIDVREPSEYQEGFIPGAINIPVKSQPDAIFLPEEEFEDRFGFRKPSEEQELIFYCKAGVRSSAAAQLAQQQGYPKVSEYRGSWLDWEKQGGTIKKP